MPKTAAAPVISEAVTPAHECPDPGTHRHVVAGDRPLRESPAAARCDAGTRIQAHARGKRSAGKTPGRRRPCWQRNPAGCRQQSGAGRQRGRRAYSPLAQKVGVPRHRDRHHPQARIRARRRRPPQNPHAARRVRQRDHVIDHIENDPPSGDHQTGQNRTATRIISKS